MPLGCQILPNGLPDPTLPQPRVVEVTEEAGAATTWSLVFDVSIADDDIALLSDARLGPDARIGVQVADGDSVVTLVSGPVTQQRISLVSGGDGSQLEVIGGDASTALGREAKVRVWPATTDAAAIGQIVTTAGMNPAGVQLPAGITHSDQKNALVQRESDLHLVQRLARRNGCWFWIEYDRLTGLPSAQVRRPPVDQPPLAELSLAGSQRNIDEVVIQWDVDRVVATDANNRDGFASVDQSGGVDRSPLAPLGALALADIVKAPRRARLSVAVDDAGDLITRSEAALIDEGWFATATVSVRMRRLGKLLRVPGTVQLSGVGTRHSGTWLIARVVHRVDDDDHLMTVTLVRNGWN
jgi:phage protein D